MAMIKLANSSFTTRWRRRLGKLEAFGLKISFGKIISVGGHVSFVQLKKLDDKGC